MQFKCVELSEQLTFICELQKAEITARISSVIKIVKPQKTWTSGLHKAEPAGLQPSKRFQQVFSSTLILFNLVTLCVSPANMFPLIKASFKAPLSETTEQKVLLWSKLSTFSFNSTPQSGDNVFLLFLCFWSFKFVAVVEIKKGEDLQTVIFWSRSRLSDVVQQQPPATRSDNSRTEH